MDVRPCEAATLLVEAGADVNEWGKAWGDGNQGAPLWLAAKGVWSGAAAGAYTRSLFSST